MSILADGAVLESLFVAIEVLGFLALGGIGIGWGSSSSCNRVKPFVAFFLVQGKANWHFVESECHFLLRERPDSGVIRQDFLLL